MTPDQWWVTHFNVPWWNWARAWMEEESARFGDVPVELLVGDKAMAGYVPPPCM